MSTRVSTQIWEWYGADEFALVLRTCELGGALEFLALDAELQSESIPDCPACEAWSTYILRINDFLECLNQSERSTLTSHLDLIWATCNNMSVACYDRQIFNNTEWVVVRQHARAALEELGWVELKEHSEDLMLTCRKALFP